MTTKKALDMLDYLVKTTITIGVASCTYMLQSALSDLKELRTEMVSIRASIAQQTSEIQIHIAQLQTRLDYHEKAQ